ncbi:hypothetical protein A3G67_01475 [Candidatus Roizmanbacteria bacterium RIFCSPLOWO2_12_FULL_40_12]|nr:MAG: hypothetical protein A3G67_01475 [Candidatus Roizmanbacteria bacterium RIFCSPLOWO2_12_FULL_40_12]
MKPRLIFINGKPGAGKDTQAERVEELYPLSTTISIGAILRGVEKGEGQFAHFQKLVEQEDLEKMKRGDILPPEKVLALVDAAIQEGIVDGVEAFIFTGFPRNLEQLDLLEGVLHHFEGKAESYFIDLAISDEIAETRRKFRYEEAIAHHERPRTDDLPETFPNRLMTYYDETQPMLDRLRGQKRLLTVNADDTIQRVFEGVRFALEGAPPRHPERR